MIREGGKKLHCRLDTYVCTLAREGERKKKSKMVPLLQKARRIEEKIRTEK